MKKTELKESGLAKVSLTGMGREKTSEKTRTKYDCYSQCMDDAWDIKGESVCASVCGC